MAEEHRTARPHGYYKKFLEKEVRPDGRTLDEFRPTVLNIGCVGTADGSALVKLGNTTIMCGVKVEIAKPKVEEPNSGFIVPNVELSPLCSSRFRSGPPGEQAQVLSQFMHETITHSECVDRESLCIVPGKFVWVLYCDLVCLDYDGNVTDACVMALLAALKNTVLPEVLLNEETETLETNITKKIPLKVNNSPVSSTFAIFNHKILFVDPTIEEEDLVTGIVTIVTAGTNLCMIRKPGGSPLSSVQLSDCIDEAFTRSKTVISLIEDTTYSAGR